MVEVEWDAIPRNGLLLLQEQELKTIVIGIGNRLNRSKLAPPLCQLYRLQYFALSHVNGYELIGKECNIGYTTW